MENNQMPERPKPKNKLKYAATAIVLSASIAACAPSQAQNPDSPTHPQATTITIPEVNPSWQSEHLLPGENFMTGTEANQIAKHLGITANSFFQFPTGEQFWQQPEILTAMSSETIFENYQSYDLPPVFPPSVLKWQAEIKQAVLQTYQRTGIFVPPEVVAITMTAESSGLPGVNSPEAHISDIGIGLMQILKSNMTHILGEGYPENQLYDPGINVLVGTGMLADGIKAISSQSGSPQPKDINYGPFLAYVIAYYNGGPNATTMSIEELMQYQGYQGTVIYRDDAQRFLMSLAIANQLKLAGLTNKEIVDQMSSTQVDAMSYALNILLIRSGNSAYNQILGEIANPQHLSEASQLVEEYQNNPTWSMPANPALRIFCKRGGDWLFLQSPENHQNSSYYYMTPEEVRQTVDSQSTYLQRETTVQRNQRRGYKTPTKNTPGLVAKGHQNRPQV